MKRRGDTVLTSISFIWSVLESCIFFILPDFYIFPATVARPHIWKRLVIASVAGSLLGSFVFAGIVSVDPLATKKLLLHIPFVTSVMFEEVSTELNENSTSVLLQSISGIPVKVWTWEAVTSNFSLGLFLFFIFISRTIRMAIIAYIGKLVGGNLPMNVTRYYGWYLLAYTAVFLCLLWFLVYL